MPHALQPAFHVARSLAARAASIRSARPSRLARTVAGLALALSLAPGLAAFAATINVTTFSDEYGVGAACSLREAITAANTNAAFGGCAAGSPGADTIILPAGTYTLSIANPGGTNEDNNASGDLDIRESLTITGAGSGSTIIQAGTTNSNGIDKVIAANPLCTAGVNVSISGVTVRYGRNAQAANSPDFSHTGAGIDWCAGTTGTFTLSNAVVSDNTNLHGYGGGLNIDSLPGNSTINITNVTFQNNTVAADSTTNQGTGAGINIFGDHLTVTISGSTFSGNQALRTNAGGGAIFFRPTSDSSLSITNSAFNNNTAQGSGGALFVTATAATTVSLTDSDVTNNTASASYGGGLYFGSAALNTTAYALTNLLVSSNHAGSSGGGIYVGQSRVTMTRSRIVSNTAPSGSGLIKSVDPGTATVSGNWWGCSIGPGAAPCDVAASFGGTLVSSPWLRNSLTGTTALVTNQTSALTASFLTDSSNAAVPLINLGREFGLGVAWAANAGTLSAQQTTVQANYTATATYTATGPGNPVISAKVDNDNTAPVSPNVLALTVSKAGTTATVNSHTPAPSLVGQSVSIGASVVGQFGNVPTAPTGIITVSDGTQNCTITLPALSCSIAFTSAGTRNLTATYGGDANFVASAASVAVAHVVNTPVTLDIDGNGTYDALTDGLLVIRYLFGLTGPSLISGAVGPNASRSTADVIGPYLDSIKSALDVDNNGQSDALTDGLMLIRYLFGLRGATLTSGAIGGGAMRDGAQIEAYIQSLMP